MSTVFVDGTNGNDANDGSSFDGRAVKTLAKALQMQAANPTITTLCVKGNIALPATASIPSGVTLSVAADGAQVTGSGNSVDGIVLKSGATLTGAGTLTMTGFKTALTAERGSTITDGTYVLKDNAAGSGTHGLFLAGTVKGSAGKDKLTITADDKSNTNFYAPGITFENCTINVNSQARTWFDAYDLNLRNASLTVKGFGQTFYVGKLNMEDSDLTINPSFYGRTGMTIQGASNIVNSRITANAGSTAGISVGVNNGAVNVTNSTLEFTNGGVGGLNVNTGTVVLTNSTIKGDGRNSGALFGAQAKGSIEFKEDCLVETPAARDADNGAGQTTKNFVVTGGSYRVKYAPGYNSGMGSTIPANGAANGDERLSLFTLADPSTAALKPLNKSGQPYDYAVAKASSDGEKHVWVPAATVTFKLNAAGAAQQVAAAYPDGSAADVTALAMRGYALETAASVARGSTKAPEAPVAAGYKFRGWFYKDATGAERPFSASTTVSADMTVYATWESDDSSYAVRYHNGAATDATYLSTSSDPARTIKVLSGDDVMKASPSFAVAGKVFKGWTTQPDGAGDAVAAGSTLAVPAGTSVIDLYATWEDRLVSVKFSANGGVFSADSVFKRNPAVFDVTTDENGGEVAVVKRRPKATDKTTLDVLLASLGDGSVSAKTKGIASPTGTNTDAAYTGIASRARHVLGNEDVELIFFGVVYGHEYYYWFTDAAGSSKAKIDGAAELTQDVTYYLKWNVDPAIEHVEGTTTIPSDMWSGSQDKTTSVKEAVTGETFSMTGAVDAAGIVSQMNALETSIAGGLDDLTKIALSDTSSTFTATITLPDGVVVPPNPTVTTTGLGDCFEVTGTSVNGQDVTVTFGLKGSYANYRQLKDAVESTGKDDAPSAVIAKPITVTVAGLTLDADNVTNGQELAATGVVSGTFSSYAENTVSGKVKKFDYAWNGEQVQGGKDPRGAGIRQTILVVKPAQQTLPADILVGGDTEHESVYPVLAGQTVDFTGTIEASVVKAQMRGIEALFPNTTDYAGIKLSDMSSSFTATFTIPEGMTLPGNLTKDAIRTDGFADTFSVSDVFVSGKTVTVTMTLKDGIKTYKDLQEAVVTNLGDTMKITLPGVKIDDDVPGGTTATVVGTVSGSFKAHATKVATGTTKVFSFTWEGVQTPEGMDATATSVDDGIRFTVQVVTPMASTLPGDMLVGANTEHDAPIQAAQGSTFDLTGALLAASIQEQMNNIEAAYPNVSHDAIMLDAMRFSFEATFTVPDGMTLPSDLDASKVIAADFGDGFKVSDVRVSGRTVTVSFGLSDPSSIKTYTDLERVVDAAGANDGWMRLTVPGVKIDGDAPAGENLTMVGTVKGSFGAAATSASGTRRVFSFAWEAVQWPDGKDAVASDDETIQLTMRVTQAEGPSDDHTAGGTTGGKDARTLPRTNDTTLPVAVVLGVAALGAAVVGFGMRMRSRRPHHKGSHTAQDER
ncbi:InlB B-repeat-containing protein [Olsenella sp. HMSC062G07]|uniref:InlB B-repeat-containing protein n=1 Tax=Olsenella sp. HMSC062G07 TaxID=1739330 RepID=UPI000AAF4D6B|nr:InlB B-repeat-containing protein [Olsenella sp. HMSC062G07]